MDNMVDEHSFTSRFLKSIRNVYCKELSIAKNDTMSGTCSIVHHC